MYITTINRPTIKPTAGVHDNFMKFFLGVRLQALFFFFIFLVIFESLGEEKIIWLSIRGNAFLSKGINESLEVLWENKRCKCK